MSDRQHSQPAVVTVENLTTLRRYGLLLLILLLESDYRRFGMQNVANILINTSDRYICNW